MVISSLVARHLDKKWHVEASRRLSRKPHRRRRRRPAERYGVPKWSTSTCSTTTERPGQKLTPASLATVILAVLGHQPARAYGSGRPQGLAASHNVGRAVEAPQRQVMSIRRLLELGRRWARTRGLVTAATGTPEAAPAAVWRARWPSTRTGAPGSTRAR
eukprot:scaffold3415_cov368-Prasinococcus_capsulatus_cf.AAC.5